MKKQLRRFYAKMRKLYRQSRDNPTEERKIVGIYKKKKRQPLNQ